MSDLKFPAIISLLGIISGLFIAILFGANEGIFKDAIQDGLKENVKIQSIEDVAGRDAKLKSEADKNWRYYQRFHFHATAIGSMSVALLLLLSALAAPDKWKKLNGWALSVSGFLYPFVWLFAGIFGPSMGRHEAKETFAPFGYMGGVYLLAAISLMALLVIYPFKESSDK